MRLFFGFRMPRTLRASVLTALIVPGLLFAISSGPGQVPREEPPERSQSGCGCGHACRAESYQGCGCGSVSCFPDGSEGTAPGNGLVAGVPQAPAPCVNGLASGNFTCRDVDLQSFVPLSALRPGATRGSSLWGFADADDGREYAVFGINTGTSVVDVTDPVNPVVIGSVAGPLSNWREVKVYQFWNPAENRNNTYAYVVSEAPTAGLQIINLSELPREISLAATYRGFDTAHTVTLAHVDLATGIPNAGTIKPVLYLAGARNPTAGIAALDISNPTSPVLLGTYTRSYGHDLWTGIFTGSRTAACSTGHDPCEIVVNWAADAIRILDWTDKTNPQIVSELIYPGLGFAHSGWISRDGNYLFSMDELDERMTGANGSVRVIDIRDLANPRVVASWMSSSRAIEHNGHTLGDKYYIAHDTRGMTVLDVSSPETPVELAYFDTYPADDSATNNGAWETYPYLPSANILVSNREDPGGLFVLRESASAPPPSAARPPVVRVAPRSRTATPR